MDAIRIVDALDTGAEKLRQDIYHAETTRDNLLIVELDSEASEYQEDVIALGKALEVVELELDKARHGL